MSPTITDNKKVRLLVIEWYHGATNVLDAIMTLHLGGTFIQIISTDMIRGWHGKTWITTVMIDEIQADHFLTLINVRGEKP